MWCLACHPHGYIAWFKGTIKIKGINLGWGLSF